MTAQHLWPTLLPRYPSSYSEELANLRHEFVPEFGPAIRRPLVNTAGENVVSVEYEMTGRQVDIFRTFYETTTKYGSESVGMLHPQQGRWSQWYDVGEWVEAYFSDRPSIQNVQGDLWSVAVEWRIVT